MADTIKKIVIEVDADDAKQELKDVDEALKKTGDNLKDVKDEAPKAGTGLKSMAEGAKSVSTGLKSILSAAGIIGLLMTLKDMLMSNEKIANLVGTAFNFLQLIMNKVVDVVNTTIDKVDKMTGGMTHTTEVIKGLMTIAITPLKLAFYEIVLVVNELMLAWEKSIFGKGDTKRITELTTNINNAGKAMLDAGKEALKAGVSIGKNIVGAIGEVVTAGKVLADESVKAYDKFDAAAEIRRAKELKGSKEHFEKMAILAQQEVDKLESVGEKYRQVRDDATKSYDSRREASSKLNSTLDEQFEAMKNLAGAHVAAAKANLELNKNAENRIALLQAQAEFETANANIEGKRSEQKAAALGLLKEEEDLKKQLAQNDWDRNKAQMDFDVTQMKDAEKRHQKQLENARLQLEGDKKISQEQSTNAKLTEAERQLALDNLKLLEQDYINKVTDINENYWLDKTQREIDHYTTIQDNEENTFEQRLEANAENNQAIIDGDYKTEEERTKALADNIKKRRELEKAATQDKLDKAQYAIDTIKSLDNDATQVALNVQQSLLNNKKISQEQYYKNVEAIQKAAAKREKAYGIGSAVISTAAAVINALTAKPFGPWNWVQSAAAAVLGAAQIAKIASTNFTSSSASSSSSVSSPSSSSSTSTAPTTSFTFADSNQKTPELPIQKTYVVSKDVTTSNQLENAIISNGTI